MIGDWNRKGHGIQKEQQLVLLQRRDEEGCEVSDVGLDIQRWKHPEMKLTELAKEGNGDLAISKLRLKTVGEKLDCEPLPMDEACITGYRIVSIVLLEKLVNDFIIKHTAESPGCLLQLSFVPDLEQQWGLANCEMC